ncbi:hypothetical protein HJC23_012032 [Cyclotella cryptica]|uniref:Uncharacterized protein n=1 Tax=Cyclotella cryptica TaxID=29204 RepID=A0ABD3PT49_9STRA
MDSMLGRGIQSTGNEYCPWLGHVLGGIPKVSRNGKDRLDDVLETCHGVMVRIDSDGTKKEKKEKKEKKKEKRGSVSNTT